METAVNRADLDPEADPTPAFPDATSVMATPFASAAPTASTTYRVPAIEYTAVSPGGASPSASASASASMSASPSSAGGESGATGLRALAGYAIVCMGAVIGGALML